MSRPALTSLFLAAAVLVAACANAEQIRQPPAAPVIVEPAMNTTGCNAPVYPRSALKNEEAGVVFFGLLVSATGNVEQGKIFSTSGVNSLDQGALVPFSKCKFEPGTIDGKPVAMWLGIHYLWDLEGDGPQLIGTLAAEAKTGNTTALYSLYYLLTRPPAADAAKAQQILNLAANKGNASAQFQLGQQFSGTIAGFAVDHEKSRYWLGKAAGSGHVLAKQALDYLSPPALH